MVLKRLWMAAAVAMALLLPQTVLASPATDFVKRKQEQLFKVVAEPKTAARQEKLKQLFDAVLDYDHFCRASLGKKWDDLDKSQRKRFCDLLTQLVRNNYRKNLEKMLEFTITYEGEGTANGHALVRSRAKHKTKAREPVIEIDFEVGSEPKIKDIYTERASLNTTYRSQFTRILNKDGFDKLIKKLEKKLKEQEAS